MGRLVRGALLLLVFAVLTLATLTHLGHPGAVAFARRVHGQAPAMPSPP
jgi:hypothetical protein